MYSLAEIRPSGPDVMTRAEAVQRFGADKVRRMLASGRWRMPHRGVVVCHNGPLADAHLLLAVLLGAPPGSALGGWSALAFDGLTDRWAHAPCVILPAGARRPRMPEVDLTFSTALSGLDVDPAARPRRTRPARSLVDAARWTPSPEVARVVLLRGVQQKLVTPAELLEVLERRGQCRHLALLRETALDAAGGAHSVPEIEFARLIRRHGLPEPRRQLVLQRPDGRYYLDAGWPDLGVGAEVEGVHHALPTQREADDERRNVLTVGGLRVLHFSSYAVRHREDRVAATLRAMLDQAT